MFNSSILSQIRNKSLTIFTPSLPKNITSPSLSQSQKLNSLLTQNTLALEDEKTFFIEDIVCSIQFPDNNSEEGKKLARSWLQNSMKAGSVFLEGVMNAHDANIKKYFPKEDIELGRFGEGCNAFFSLVNQPNPEGSKIIYTTTYLDEQQKLQAYEATIYKDPLTQKLAVTFKICNPKATTGTHIKVIPIHEGLYDNSFLKECLNDLKRLSLFEHGNTLINFKNENICIKSPKENLPTIKVTLCNNILEIKDEGTGISIENFQKFVLIPNKTTKSKDAVRLKWENLLNNPNYLLPSPKFVILPEKKDSKISMMVVTVSGLVNMTVSLPSLILDNNGNIVDLEIPFFPGTNQTANRKALSLEPSNSLESRYLMKVIEQLISKLKKGDLSVVKLIEPLFEGLKEWESLENMRFLRGIFSKYLKTEVNQFLNQTKNIIPLPLEDCAFYIQLFKFFNSGNSYCYIPLKEDFLKCGYKKLENELHNIYRNSLNSTDEIQIKGFERQLIHNWRVLFIPDKLMTKKSIYSNVLFETLICPMSIIENLSEIELRRKICDLVSPLDAILEEYNENTPSPLDRYSVYFLKEYKEYACYPENFRNSKKPGKTWNYNSHHRFDFFPIYENSQHTIMVEELCEKYKEIILIISSGKNFDEEKVIHYLHSKIKENIRQSGSPKIVEYLSKLIHEDGIFPDELKNYFFDYYFHYNLFDENVLQEFDNEYLRLNEDDRFKYFENFLRSRVLLSNYSFIWMIIHNEIKLDNYIRKSLSHLDETTLSTYLHNFFQEFYLDKLKNSYLINVDIKVVTEEIKKEYPTKQIEFENFKTFLSSFTVKERLFLPFENESEVDFETFKLIENTNSFFEENMRGSIQNLIHCFSFTLTLNSYRSLIGEELYEGLLSLKEQWNYRISKMINSKVYSSFKVKYCLNKKANLRLFFPQFYLSLSQIYQSIASLRDNAICTKKLLQFQSNFMDIQLNSDNLWEFFLLTTRCYFPSFHSFSPLQEFALMYTQCSKTAAIQLLEFAESAEELMFMCNFFLREFDISKFNSLDSGEIILAFYKHIIGKVIPLEKISEIIWRNAKDHDADFFPEDILKNMTIFATEISQTINKRFVTSFPLLPEMSMHALDNATPFSIAQLASAISDNEALTFLEEGKIGLFLNSICKKKDGDFLETKINKLVKNRTETNILEACIKELSQNSHDAIAEQRKLHVDRKVNELTFGIKILRKNDKNHLILESHDLAGMSHENLFKHFLMPDSSSKSQLNTMDQGGMFGNGSWVFQNAKKVLILSRDPTNPKVLYLVTMIPNVDKSNCIVRYADISDSEELKDFFGTKFILQFPCQSYFESVASSVHLQSTIERNLKYTKQSWTEDRLEMFIQIGDSRKTPINTVLDQDIVPSITQKNSEAELNIYEMQNEDKEKQQSIILFHRQYIGTFKEFVHSHQLMVPNWMVEEIGKGMIFTLNPLSKNSLMADQSRSRLLLNPKSKKLLQRTLLDSFYIYLLNKAMTNRSLMEKLIRHQYSEYEPDQLLSTKTKFSQKLEDLNKLSSNEFMLTYEPGFLNKSISAFLSELYFNILESDFKLSKLKLMNSVNNLIDLHNSQQIDFKAISMEIERIKKQFSEEMIALSQKLDTHINLKTQVVPLEHRELFKTLFKEWFAPKLKKLEWNVLEVDLKSIQDKNTCIMNSERLLEVQKEKESLENPINLIKKIVPTLIPKRFICEILNEMARNLSDCNDCQFYFKADAKQGYFTPVTKLIYLNLYHISLANQLEFAVALMEYKDTHSLPGHKKLIGLDCSDEGVLVHELQHFVDDQNSNYSQTDTHGDGMNRFGKIVPFPIRAISWFEEKYFSGNIFKTRQYLTEMIKTNNIDISELKKLISLIKQVEVNDTGKTFLEEFFYA